MTDPLRLEKSRAEMLCHAVAWMLGSYGSPRDFLDQENKDRWYERLGMLTDFINEVFPE